METKIELVQTRIYTNGKTTFALAAKQKAANLAVAFSSEYGIAYFGDFGKKFDKFISKGDNAEYLANKIASSSPYGLPYMKKNKIRLLENEINELKASMNGTSNSFKVSEGIAFDIAVSKEQTDAIEKLPTIRFILSFQTNHIFINSIKGNLLYDLPYYELFISDRLEIYKALAEKYWSVSDRDYESPVLTYPFDPKEMDLYFDAFLKKITPKPQALIHFIARVNRMVTQKINNQ